MFGIGTKEYNELLTYIQNEEYEYGLALMKEIERGANLEDNHYYWYHFLAGILCESISDNRRAYAHMSTCEYQEDGFLGDRIKQPTIKESDIINKTRSRVKSRLIEEFKNEGGNDEFIEDQLDIYAHLFYGKTRKEKLKSKIIGKKVALISVGIIIIWIILGMLSSNGII